MKIISKFQDYYDSALGYGVDETQILLRKQTDYITKDIQLPAPLSGINKKYTFFTLGFCGKWVRGVKVQTGDFTECFYSPTLLSSNFFSKKDIQELTQKSKFGRSTLLEDIDKWLTGDPSEWYSRDSRYKKVTNKLTDNLFIENNTPVLVIEHLREHIAYVGFRNFNRITVWPKLKDYNFQKVCDPYTAFQEISMYQFGVIGSTEVDMVSISDKDRYDMKGFDMQYGFRKRPK